MMIGRENEREKLQELYDSKSAEMVAVYGRRQVGKTFLIDEVFKGRLSFRHAGLSPIDDRYDDAAKRKSRMKDQLKHFHRSLVLAGLTGSKMPGSWLEAFYLLEDLLAKKDDGQTVADEEDTDVSSEEDTEEAAAEGESEASDTEESEAADAEGSENTDAEDAEASVEETQTAPDTEEHKKTSFFGRKKNKEKEKLEQQIEDLTDKLRRSLAEFDNFRKRTEKEKASMYVIGAKDIVEKILPVLDSFERGLAQAADRPDDPFAEGMQMIYKQLMTALEELGVKPIEAVGKEFDPNLHNAVMHVDDEEAGENVVVEEFQKGYTYKDFVVRHSMVKVAN